jgi:hypothetical protein
MVMFLQIAGGALSFIFACISVGKDLRDELHRVAKGPRTGTSVIRNEYALLFLIGWGLIGVLAYVVAQCYPEWFERAFNLKLDKNSLLAGLLIGASTVIIIRSNLITLAKMPIGGEYIYSLTRARVVFIMNKRRGLARFNFLKAKKTYSGNMMSYPNYFTKMDSYVTMIGPPLPNFNSVTTEIASIKAGAPNPDQDAAAREAITGVMYDYFGPLEVENWGQHDNWGS